MPHGVLANLGDENGNAMRRVIYLTWDAAEILRVRISSISDASVLTKIYFNSALSPLVAATMYLSFLLPLSVIFTPTQVISTYVGTEVCPGIDYGRPPVAADKPPRNGFTAMFLT